MLETPFAQIKPVTGTNGGRSGALAASDGQNDAPETDFDTAYNDNAPAAASENEEAESKRKVPLFYLPQKNPTTVTRPRYSSA